MALNDREKFIMHMSTVMTLSSLGDPIDIMAIQKEVVKNRCRKLTDKQINELFDDIKEEVLNGRSVYEEMIAKLKPDHKLFRGDMGDIDDLV